MLESLILRNFTAFSDAEFNFADGLNVIVGENGTGTTHVLKAAYSLAYVSARGAMVAGTPGPTKSYLQSAIGEKLLLRSRRQLPRWAISATGLVV
jgi:AAA15 family ATPase/GTPase